MAVDIDEYIWSPSFGQLTPFVEKQHVECPLLFCGAPSSIIFFS